jgi:hypothetical protein
MNANYKKGARLEYLIRDKLRKAGYFCNGRSAGSHGVDLIALPPFGLSMNLASLIGIKGRWETRSILFVSCKVGEYIPPNERLSLLKAAKQYGAVAMTFTGSFPLSFILQVCASGAGMILSSRYFPSEKI